MEPVEEVVVAVGMTGRVGARLPDDGCHGFGNGDVFSVPTCWPPLCAGALPFAAFGAVLPSRAENGLF